MTNNLIPQSLLLPPHAEAETICSNLASAIELAQQSGNTELIQMLEYMQVVACTLSNTLEQSYVGGEAHGGVEEEVA